MASTGTKPAAPQPDHMLDRRPDHTNRATKPAATTPGPANRLAMTMESTADTTMDMDTPMPMITSMITAVTITTTPQAPAAAYSARRSR